MEKPEELLIANLIYPIIKGLLLPKIKNIINGFPTYNIDKDSTEKNFQTYLSQRYEKYLIIDTLVFPNQQTLFKTLYEPLTVICYNEDKKKNEVKIDKFSEELLPKYFRVIIEDTAGMGKSTITKKLFLSAIEENKGIPILIELRQINRNNDFLKEIQNQLSPLGEELSTDFILKLLSEGEFIFLFDGFDEISKKDKAFVLKDLNRFIEKANNNYFLITSRQEDSLVSFGDFQKFSVRPLNDKEAFNLIKRYDSYSFKPIAEELISQIKLKKDEDLKDFLTNPFLVSLLYKSFEYKKDIPLKKTQFYRQVYDALFESHDLSKEGFLKRDKHSSLHLDDFEKVLRHIGYFTSIENKVEYEKNYILNTIDRAKKYTPELIFKSSDYLRDLIETVPLFKKDGNNIKWAHKSLQDYFAAKFIWLDAKEFQTVILKKIFDDNENRRFFNVLDLFYELDTRLFNKTILLWLLEDFEKYYSSTYQEFPHIQQETLENRVENSYHKNCVIIISRKKDYASLSSGSKKPDHIFDHYERKAREILLERTHTTFNYFENPKVIALTFVKVNSKIDTILKLISLRMPELARFASHKVYLKKLNLLEEDKIYPLDDKPENILNNAEIFGLVNDLIISDYTINYKYALEKLKEIKSYFKMEDDNELINW